MASQDPARSFYDIVPHDTNSQAPFRALYIGSTGDVAVVGLDDAVAVFVGVPTGAILPVVGKRVNDTDTSATSIVALV